MGVTPLGTQVLPRGYCPDSYVGDHFWLPMSIHSDKAEPPHRRIYCYKASAFQWLTSSVAQTSCNTSC